MSPRNLQILEAADPADALREIMSTFGAAVAVDSTDPVSLYTVEHSFLQSYTVAPLVYLPRAYGVSTRVHTLALSPNGSPLLGYVSLEDAR